MSKQNKKPKQHKIWKIILIALGGIVGVLFVAYAIFLTMFDAWGMFGSPFWFEEGYLRFGERSCCEGEELRCAPFVGYGLCGCYQKDSFPMVDKPIIYLYPEVETEVEIKLGKPEKLTVTYPEYKNGWKVTAYPGGDLVEKETGKKMYALYWEGRDDYSDVDLSEGFVVRNDEVAEFLEEKLEILGLNYREKEEFITYWLPKMAKNEYNLVKFLTAEEMNERMPIEVSAKPDTMIRVMMLMKETDGGMEVKEQKLEKAPERKGFTLVEWGGSELGK